MKVCLIAINSKYIHTNPAVYSLQAFVVSKGYECEVAEYSINQTDEHILKGLYRLDADMYAFSVYIWNVVWVKRLIKELKKVRPDAIIWLGGPEASYDAFNILKENVDITGVMRGEGEEVFYNLLKAYDDALQGANAKVVLSDVNGITYRDSDNSIASTPDAPAMNMDDLVFPYYDKTLDPHRIYYYESSRGCPYSCAYCLSSVDKKVRFKSIDMVKRELKYFLDNNATQVKFVDRTFNAGREHALQIWRFIKENDNGITNFHFEIGGDILDEEELEVLESLRPGQVQLEIGVQTTYPDTMKAINRVADWNKISKNVRRLISFKNIHIHLDLIAGLPYEDMDNFKKSFNDVYDLRPLQLQLGFLKVLKGTAMEHICKKKLEIPDKYSDCYKYLSVPPYEVLSTPWISYDEILELKAVEEMVEVYYNSRQFENTMSKLEQFFDNSFEMYTELARYYEKNDYFDVSHNRMRRYEILREFIASKQLDESIFIPLLLRDAYARERLKHFPEWGKGYEFENQIDYEKKDPLTGNYEACSHNT